MATERLKFPIEGEDDYKGKIIFTAYDEDYQTLGKTGFQIIETLIPSESVATETSDNNGFGTNPQGEFGGTPTARDIEQLNGQNASQQTAGSGSATRRASRSVQLYLPQTLQFSDRVEYTNVDLGIVGSAAANAIAAGQNGLAMAREALANSIPDFESFKDLITNGLGGEAAQVAALRIAGRINGAVQGAIETTTGVALNPNRRSTLRGIGIRRFQFTFKLIPTSRQEAEAIGKIVRFFREEMYPESSNLPGTAIAAALKFPAKFNISMRYENKSVATGILPCFLESVNTTYNPNAMAFIKDGYFQETDITLSFIEERALTKADIQKGL